LKRWEEKKEEKGKKRQKWQSHQKSFKVL
jgi:hypothetical protein